MYFPQWIKKHGFLKQTYLNAQGLVFGSKALVDCIVCKITILDLRLMFGDSLSRFSSNITLRLRGAATKLDRFSVADVYRVPLEAIVIGLNMAATKGDNMAATKAPFETFGAHEDRVSTGVPYNETFLAECREKAKEYDKEDIFLRGSLLTDLEKSIPMHFRSKVFDGISFTRCR